MKLIIIAVVALLILGAGVLSGMALLGMGGPLAPYLPQLMAEAPKIEIGPQTPITVNVDPVTVPVIEANEVVLQVTIEFKLLVNRHTGPSFYNALPRLYSSFIKDLVVFLPIHLQDRTDIDKEALKRRIMIVSEKMMGANVVQDVTFESISYKQPTP